MKTRFLLLTLLILFASTLYSQDNYRALIYNGTGNGADHSRGVVLDNLGNIYVTGDSWGTSSSEDYVTIKYVQTGSQQWVARYNGTEGTADIAYAIAVDASGNVYVTGRSQGSGALDCGTSDYCTIKYNTNGVQQWVARYDGGTQDTAYALALDASANVYVTGTSVSSNNKQDIVTIKYNTNGVQQWLARFDGASHDNDIGKAIKVDWSGNVFVTGSSFATGAGMDYITIKYNSAGAQLWAARYNGPGNGNDIANALALDGAGNTVVTGGSKGASSNIDFATIKYDPNGTPLWTQRLNGTANDTDIATAVALDIYGVVYVTGYSKSLGANYDFLTVRYDPYGNETWHYTHNGPANGIDKASDIKITKRPCGIGDAPCFNFDIYVTGQSQGSGYDYVTIKYNVKGVVQWVKTYNSPQNTDDVPATLAVIDGSDYVFVTGTGNNNYCTVWYFPDNPPGNENVNVPVNNQLAQNYPNPFNPTTIINYAMANSSYVTLKVYDMLGNEVVTLVDSYQSSGNHSAKWNAGDIASGIYFYTLTSNGIKIETRKMLLVK